MTSRGSMRRLVRQEKDQGFGWLWVPGLHRVMAGVSVKFGVVGLAPPGTPIASGSCSVAILWLC